MHKFSEGCITCGYNYEGGYLEGLYALHRAIMSEWMRLCATKDDANMTDAFEAYHKVFGRIIEEQRREYQREKDAHERE